jgi:hypothetical protein
MFELRPVVEVAEGQPIEVPAGFDAARYRLVGNVAGPSPRTGVVMHHGWVASRCQLPSWSGASDTARIIAPVEVELK